MEAAAEPERTAAAAGFRLLPDRTISNHDQIARTLAMDILSGRVKPGDTIPVEPELLSRFEVSRTVLREVIKTLTAKGLVVARTRVGTKVMPTEHWNMFDAQVLSWKLALGYDASVRDDIAQIRLALEPRAAALAAQRRTREQLAGLRRWIAKMREPNHTRRSFAEVDLGFHLAIGAASGNALMRGISAVIEAALLTALTLSSAIDEPELLAQSVRNHESIVDAIEARDSDAAAEAMLNVISLGVTRIAAAQSRKITNRTPRRKSRH
jgi:DNA-binding FadR family transcriptional regulator